MLICSTVIPIHPQGNMNICISCKTQMSVITIYPLGAMNVCITILQNGRQTKMKCMNSGVQQKLFYIMPA